MIILHGRFSTKLGWKIICIEKRFHELQTLFILRVAPIVKLEEVDVTTGEDYEDTILDLYATASARSDALLLLCGGLEKWQLTDETIGEANAQRKAKKAKNLE
ncbi:hypothetical protein L6452_30409 [Arctium lappa]|uniref:Uncharacterized protein n=1 Tax=Arctium lappa TaxID=4217 RepID=A0ACB8ZIS8_ARCLA|nr:hypothetical protein L6452_30409 [Arctium lappa]